MTHNNKKKAGWIFSTDKREDLLKLIAENKRGVLGVYALKSPYHEKEHYLPFIILSYEQSNNTYNVWTVEYKGMISYKIDTCYSEKSIWELITQGIIEKKANPNNYKDNEEVKELLRQYMNANN